MPRRLLAVALVVFLVGPAGAQQPKPAESLRDFVRKNASRHAVGLFLQGKKIGWMIAEVKLGRLGDRDVAVETTEMLIALMSDGEKSEIKQNSVTYYSLDGTGPIVQAEESNIQDKQETTYKVTAAANGLKITTAVGGRTSERVVPLPKSDLAMSRKLMNWLTSEPKLGAKFEHYSTSWEEKDVDQKEVFTFKGKKKILWGGVLSDVFAVQIDMQGAKFDAEVLANGNPVRGKLGALIEMRAETEEVAKQLDAVGVDMLAASSIKVDRDLGDAKLVTALTMQVTGIKDFTLPMSHRQTIREENGKTILELKADYRNGKTAALSDADKKKFTEATPTIQCDVEPIQKLAAKIVGTETDPVKKAVLLKNWVYRTLRKSMASNATTALAVLDNKAGDCTEHTLLFVTLARACGVPARELTGVAYVSPIFGWHAWAEIHDGKQWVSVDPTWDELYVDATHIVFTHDNSDHAWLNVLGAVRFKVLQLTVRQE